MKKLIATLLLAAFSLTTFAGMPPQQDTVKKVHKQKSKPKSKMKKRSSKTDTTKTDTLRKM
jgi:Ni/Co efflux regulator RcnB